MMKRMLIPIVMLACFLVFGTGDANAQCNAKQYEQSNLIRMPSGFKHKHTFEIDKSVVDAKGEVEMTFILNKGTLYMLNMSNFRGEEKNIVIELYNQRKELVAVNFNEATGRYWPIGYACPESGVHYIKFRFKGTDNYCGIGVLAERR